MALGLRELSDEALSDGVIESGAAVELQINRGLRLAWSTDAKREMRSLEPKCLRASDLVRIMLNPRLVRSSSSSLTKLTESGVKVDVWGPVSMAARMEVIGHCSPTEAGKPCLEYESRSLAAGWKVEVGAVTIGCWMLVMMSLVCWPVLKRLPMARAADTNGSTWGGWCGCLVGGTSGVWGRAVW